MQISIDCPKLGFKYLEGSELEHNVLYYSVVRDTNEIDGLAFRRGDKIIYMQYEGYVGHDQYKDLDGTKFIEVPVGVTATVTFKN